MTYATEILILEALRMARAELQGRRHVRGTLAAIDRAIAAHTAERPRPPVGCDQVAIPLHLTDAYGTGVGGPARLILTLDIRPSDNTPNAEDEYVVVAHRIEMDAQQPTERLVRLLKAASADNTLEVA